MRAAALALVLVLTACGGSEGSGTPSDEPNAAPSTEPGPSPGTAPSSTAPSTVPAATGPVVLDERGGGAGPQVCSIIAASRVEDWLGGALNPAEVAGPLESGCEWDVVDGEAALMIQAMSADFYVEAEGSTGSEPLAGVGDDAYTAPGLFDDYTAWARVGELMMLVSVEGTDDDKGLATEIMRGTIDQVL